MVLVPAILLVDFPALLIHTTPVLLSSIDIKMRWDAPTSTFLTLLGTTLDTRPV